MDKFFKREDYSFFRKGGENKQDSKLTGKLYLSQIEVHKNNLVRTLTIHGSAAINKQNDTSTWIQLKAY